MNINGPSLRIPQPVPEDITPQRPVEGGGTAPPLPPGDPVLGELADLQDRQATVQSLLVDMSAMRANLLSQLEMLVNRQGLPPEKRDAIRDRMDQQLTLAFEQTVKRLDNLSRQETLNRQDMSTAIAQFVDAVSTLAGSLDAMRGGGRSGGKIA
jgi:hypothetical protein